MRERMVPLRNALHQFRVLTARYTELLLGDPRSLRLLLLQAPIVAVFLLMGFFDKNFQDSLPDLRAMNEQEKTMLRALDAVSDLAGGNKPLTEEQSQALKRVQVEVPLADRSVTLNGVQLLGIVHRLHELPGNAKMHEVLQSARLTFSEADGTYSLTLAEFTQLFRQLHESGLIQRFLDYKGPFIPQGQIINPRYTYILLFILVMIVMWFGCNNAAKEIVKEEAIYGRERAVNLGIVPYLGSKFLVLSLITMVHAFLLMVILYGTLAALHAINPEVYSVPSPSHMLNYPAQFGVLALLATTGVAMGLVLSACVSSPDRANALLPYVLIPQMILGGGFLAVSSGPLYYLAVVLSPVYWAYRAVHLGTSKLPELFPGHTNYSDNIWLPCQALALQTIVLLGLTAVLLRRKDV
jgi:hypothetical protein